MKSVARQPPAVRYVSRVVSTAIVIWAYLLGGSAVQAQTALDLPGHGGLTFVSGESTFVTLPAASGGTSPYTYSLSSDSIALLQTVGLSFNPSNRAVSADVPDPAQWGVAPSTCWGIVPCLQSTLIYKVSDNVGAEVERTIGLDLYDFPESFLRAPDDLYFTPNTAIDPVTLPATAADGTSYQYDLAGLPPPGLSFDSTGRVLSGTPTAPGTTTLTYRASHRDSVPTVTHTATFRIVVGSEPLVLPDQDDLAFVSGHRASVTLPAATGGRSPYTYSLTADSLPNFGLSFDRDTHTVSADVRSSSQWGRCWNVVPCLQESAVYEVVDDFGETTSTTFGITFYDFPESFLPEQNDLSFVPDTAIVPVTLPATDADADSYRYTLTDLPPGLSFDQRPGERIVSGTPTRVGTSTVTYTATHEDLEPAVTHTTTFSIRVVGLDLPEQDRFVFVADRSTSAILPLANGGTPPYTYSLIRGGNLPLAFGMSFDPDTRTLLANVPDHSEWGTPTSACWGLVACVDSGVLYKVTDSAGAEFERAIEFTLYDFPSSFLPSSAALYLTRNRTMTPVTLPTTAADTTRYRYTLASLPTGLSFDPGTRTLSGTPTTKGTSTARYRATHRDLPGVVHTTSLTINVGELQLPWQGNLIYPENVAIDPLVLPAASGGTEPYAYTLTGPNDADLSEVPGLSFDPDTRTLSGTPTEVGATTLIYTATDSVDPPNEITRTFRITVIAAGQIGIAELSGRTWPIDGPVELRLPAAIGGTGPYTYTLTGPNGKDLSEVPGLSFDPDTRTLSGTPTETGTTILTYTATDSAAPPASAARTVTVTITGTGNIPVAEPISVDEPGDRTYTAGQTVDSVLPAGMGSVAPYTYTLTGPNGKDLSEVPGLSFDPDTRTLSGIPTRAGTTELTYTVTSSASPPASVTRTFEIRIDGPKFVSRVADRTYPANRPIDPLVLPRAVGAGPLIYALSGPKDEDVSEAVPGLSFGPVSRTVSGTPTRAGVTALSYTATDRYGNTAATTFTVTVEGILSAVNEVLLPEVARAMTDSTVGAIARRIERATEDAGAQGTGMNLGGQSTWGAALRTHGEAVSEGRLDLEELLAGSDFALVPRDTANVPATLWGRGEYRSLSGKDDRLDWDGELVGVHLGVDERLREDLLGGIAVSRLWSNLDYRDVTTDGSLGRGIHEVELTGVHPYLGWRPEDQYRIWTSVGYSRGEVAITPNGARKQSTDLDMRTVGVGGQWTGPERGASTMRLRGEVTHSTLEVEGNTVIEGLKVDVTRVRMTVEAGRTYTLDNAGVLKPSLEAGMRHDSGDGETGGGVEVGGRLSYRDRARGITVEGRTHALVAGHGSDYREWGIEGHLDVSPGTRTRGLSLSFRPSYGDSGDGGRKLWHHGVPKESEYRARAGEYRMEARLGYGLPLRGYPGIFTPYTELTAGSAERYRIGVNWRAGSNLDLDLLGERREPVGRSAEHALVLRGEVLF